MMLGISIFQFFSAKRNLWAEFKIVLRIIRKIFLSWIMSSTLLEISGWKQSNISSIFWTYFPPKIVSFLATFRQAWKTEKKSLGWRRPEILHRKTTLTATHLFPFQELLHHLWKQKNPASFPPLGWFFSFKFIRLKKMMCENFNYFYLFIKISSLLMRNNSWLLRHLRLQEWRKFCGIGRGGEIKSTSSWHEPRHALKWAGASKPMIWRESSNQE